MGKHGCKGKASCKSKNGCSGKNGCNHTKSGSAKGALKTGTGTRRK